MHSSGFFRIKLIARLILKREILGSHTISDQSLLLSTNVLNDIVPPPLHIEPNNQTATCHLLINIVANACSYICTFMLTHMY